MSNALRLLLVEDQTVVRQGLKRLLDMQPEVEVVGEASSAADSVEKARNLDPDVVIMDLKLGGDSGIDASESILAHQPCAQILVLSAYDDFPIIERAIAAGILGYAPKLASFEELMEAIQTVGQGKRYIHPVIADRLMEGMRNSYVQRSSKEPGLDQRERELLRHVAEGLSYREIAVRIYSSERSVRRHIQAICDKLGVTDRVQAVAAALRNQWL